MQGRGCECHLWLVMEQESKLVAEPGQAGWKKLKQSAITECSISIAFFWLDQRAHIILLYQ